MTTDNPGVLFHQRLATLVLTLNIPPQVADNQVLDRVALSFRKLLNFLAQEDVPGQTLFDAQAKSMLISTLSDNFAQCQEGGLFRNDMSSQWLARCFVGMLDQIVQEPADAALRHQQSVACAKILCEGIWPGAVDSRV
ncbi:hypothetical protein ACMV8I_14570 [Ewingella sp. S1.OA.A_B6]